MPEAYLLRPPDLLQKLARRIEAIESSRRPQGCSAVPFGIPALDGGLPEGGVPAGSLVELLSTADGAGAWTLGLRLAVRASGERKALVVVDGSGCFYPPAAAKLGADLRRAIVVRPKTRRDAYATANLSLRCAAVGAVLAWCDRLSTLEFRRLQLSAEAGAGLGVLFRGAGAVREPSFATLRLLVSPVASADAARRIRVDVARCRGGKGGQSLILEVDGETGDVRVPAEVAPPATGARAARASG